MPNAQAHKPQPHTQRPEGSESTAASAGRDNPDPLKGGPVSLLSGYDALDKPPGCLQHIQWGHEMGTNKGHGSHWAGLRCCSTSVSDQGFTGRKRPEP